MKICSIVGARPQFIKLAPLSIAFSNNSNNNHNPIHNHIIIHTGQHYDKNMSDSFFKQLGIPEPNYNLNVGSGPQGQQTAIMLEKIEQTLIKEKPDWVVIFGDTNSTLAGALAAKKLHIKTAHIEAGMRSFDKDMPEEINRIITDHCSTILFCPDNASKQNLIKENITENIHVIGNIMDESLGNNIKKAESTSNILNQLNLNPQQYHLATVHRQSNTDNIDNLNNIVEAMIESNETIIFPAHPRTKKALEQSNNIEKINSSKIKLIEPINYFDMLILQKNAKKVLTDSGGIQNEAFQLATPCITLRTTTEWTNTIDQKANILVGADKEKILNAINSFNPHLEKKEPKEKPSTTIMEELEKFG